MVEWIELLTVRAETEAMMKSKVAKPLFDRQSHELEETREELSKAEAELHRLREELTHSRTQKEKIHSQVTFQLNNKD